MCSRLWMIRTYGLRRYLRYVRARRAGVVIDYALVFSPAERAHLESLGLAPWKGANDGE